MDCRGNCVFSLNTFTHTLIHTRYTIARTAYVPFNPPLARTQTLRTYIYVCICMSNAVHGRSPSPKLQ